MATVPETKQLFDRGSLEFRNKIGQIEMLSETLNFNQKRNVYFLGANIFQKEKIRK